MTHELRCAAKLHGILHGPVLAETTYEVSCSSRFCGAGKGIVVRHRFRLTWSNDQPSMICDTRRFKAPERKPNASSGIDPAVRPPRRQADAVQR